MYNEAAGMCVDEIFYEQGQPCNTADGEQGLFNEDGECVVGSGVGDGGGDGDGDGKGDGSDQGANEGDACELEDGTTGVTQINELGEPICVPSGDTGTGGVDDQPTSCADIDCSQPRPEGMVTFDLIAQQKLYDSCCAEPEGECTNGASNYPAYRLS